MDTYVTGITIKNLREKKGLTQTDLADMLGVSSKAVSKWETAKGLPDISLIEPLANALSVSVMELMTGDPLSIKTYRLISCDQNFTFALFVIILSVRWEMQL